jgi:hypothetical protein
MAAPRNSLHPLSPPYTISPSLDDSPFSSQIKLDEQPTERRYDSYFPQRPRRRREMQAITKIVETREYPYVDGFFWKNNGNTIQKKTGNKSVYYKCYNSSKVILGPFFFFFFFKYCLFDINLILLGLSCE